MARSPILEFTNTVDWHGRTDYGERLTSYAALVDWAVRQGVLSDSDAGRLLRAAAQRPEAAAAVLARAIALREALYRVFSATAHGRTPDEADVATVNDAIPPAFQHLQLARHNARFDWTWAGPADALDRMLWPVVRSAAQLLTADALARVRECANDPCGWLFLDTSKNRSRRWCSMADCGNRVKARRHYQRVRAARATASGVASPGPSTPMCTA
jgi:predicted RNA-binding Zn ribbon-like protein